MEKLDCPIGHKTLQAVDIAPEKAPSFSPNLYRYLKAKGLFYRGGGVAESVFTVRPGTKAAEVYGAGTLMLGYLDDGFLVGTRLISALCNGAKTERMAHPIGKSVDPVDGFWDKYLKIGRCAIDPEHQEQFLSDRFQVQGDTRTCRWCGHKQHKIVTPRVVHDESWVTG